MGSITIGTEHFTGFRVFVLVVIQEHHISTNQTSQLLSVSAFFCNVSFLTSFFPFSLKEDITPEKLSGVKLWITAGPREKFTAGEVSFRENSHVAGLLWIFQSLACSHCRFVNPQQFLLVTHADFSVDLRRDCGGLFFHSATSSNLSFVKGNPNLIQYY